MFSPSRLACILVAAAFAACGPSPREIEEAERHLVRARAEIEEIAGLPSPDREPPPLPTVPRVRLSEGREEAFLAGVEARLDLARTALALRLEALEDGGYRARLEEAPPVATAPFEAEKMAYLRLPDGGARLRLTSDRLVAEATERRRPALRTLLAWDLPPL